MKNKSINKEMLESHFVRLNNVSDKVENFGRRLEIVIYELITKKKCNYKWNDNLERYFNEIEPTIIASFNSSHPALLKLLNLRSELISTYHLFQEDYYFKLDFLNDENKLIDYELK